MMCVLVAIVVGVLTQLHDQEMRVARQRGLIDQETVLAIRELASSDGLFNLPELGTKNTLETRIDATFLASEMAQNSIYTLATEETRDSLFSYARNEKNPLGLRLKSYVALRNFEDKRWRDGLGLAKAINKSMPPSVSESNVAEYLAVAEPLILLDDEFKPRTKLLPFKLSNAEQSERLAASTIILDYLFTNGSEIRENFRDLESKMCGWASGGAKYPQQTLFAANALIGTKRNECINTGYIESLYGCKDSSQFLSVDGKSSGTCSLTLTYYAYRIGVTK